MAKLKIGGVWVGVLEVELDNWTVPMLREEVARRSNIEPGSIKLICTGKVLKDGDGAEKLIQLGIRNNAKILATRISVEEGNSLKEELIAEEERSSRLARVKAAATALSKRHADGSLPLEDFNLEIQNQGGEKVQLGSETDQQAIMMGLMFHANAKNLIKRQKFKNALEVLAMGEEAFSLCNQKILELVDNVPILQLDMVWCYFLLQDISSLSVAGMRLEKAREGIERCHGKDLSRVRFLQAGRQPELALHMRLELLEGVLAYHNGDFDKSRKTLNCAKEKFLQLQVPDEALSHVMSMGFKECDAQKALRLNNQDVASAVDFLFEEKSRREKKREDDIQHRKEILEQKRYGMTPLKRAVNLEKLKELVSIGFEKFLAAEALRRNENDFQKALDDLTNPELNSAMQVSVESRKRKRQQRAAEARIEELVSMGFERSRVVAAVQAALQSGGNMEQILTQLISQLDDSDANPSDSKPNDAGPSTVTSLAEMSTIGSLNNNDIAGSSSDEDTVVGPLTAGETEKRDVEMEDELAQELENVDHLSDYDIEVTREGDAIYEYLALLASADVMERASSLQ
ncbi:hypothetical protein SLEP1_g12640 [Rubroshorea leprosula]|uniref:NEDD8 ultimate buster 1 n=1 Tax=Rubroshorea leprosula TaxID=152421 RepID=A0AAV5IPJ9_9ROSI|nr:hypothetical protein SLEP1_g12640 [Rubroshorea leprosula]